MKEIIKTLSEKYKNKTTLAVILITGMILMLASGELFGSPEVKNNSEASETKQYRQEIEQDLTDILSEMKGVDNVHVMVTLEKKNSTSSGTKDLFSQKSNSYSSHIPAVSGAVIAARGVKDAETLEKIYYAAKAVLNISGSRIAVIESK